MTMQNELVRLLDAISANDAATALVALEALTELIEDCCDSEDGTIPTLWRLNSADEHGCEISTFFLEET